MLAQSCCGCLLVCLKIKPAAAKHLHGPEVQWSSIQQPPHPHTSTLLQSGMPHTAQQGTRQQRMAQGIAGRHSTAQHDSAQLIRLA
jgi:hypothetical protein